MRRRRTKLAAIVGSGAVLLVACNALVGLDRDYAVAEGDGSLDGRGDATDVVVVDEDAGDVVGDGGLDADADVDVPCRGTAGPTMVRINAATSYCIDSTEVTEADYALFVASGVGFGAARPSACAWKASFVPGSPDQELKCRWDPETYPHLPVTCVDWCDAYAYCQWAGKRLCGEVGGGSVPWDAGIDTNQQRDEWYRACSRAGGREYPYDTRYAVGACNDREAGVGELVDAGAMTQCQGGYPGIYDMVGNAFEFENSCSGDSGADDTCLLRGGSWAKSPTEFSRCSGRGVGDLRRARFDDLGIRCCSN